MIDWSKLYLVTRFFPEVQHADQLTPNLQKVIYTAISLFIFLIASHLPLYGMIPVQQVNVPDPSYWGHPFFAPNGSLLALGIGPILLSEIVTQILVASSGINVDSNAPEARTLLNRVQKLMGILLTVTGAVTRVLGLCSVIKLGTGNAVLILLQIIISGIIVIYLDDVLKKGYGLLSGISLFTAATICENVLWKAFSLTTFIYPEQGTEFEGAVPAWVHLLITKTDKFSAMREAFYRQNLPNVTGLLATCLFVLIVISFEGLSIVLPVRTHIPGFQVNYLIKISNIFYGPIILHRLLVSFLYNISKMFYMKCGGNRLLNLLGTWNRSNHSRQSFLVGGILYYITTPQRKCIYYVETLPNIASFQAFIYVACLLGACTYLSVLWLRLCLSSKRFWNGFINVWAEQRVIPAQPDAIPRNEFVSHLLKAARLGGFCVGALIIFGDFIGVFGSGTGIMLAVTALYPYFDGRSGEVGALGF